MTAPLLSATHPCLPTCGSLRRPPNNFGSNHIAIRRRIFYLRETESRSGSKLSKLSCGGKMAPAGVTYSFPSVAYGSDVSHDSCNYVAHSNHSELYWP